MDEQKDKEEQPLSQGEEGKSAEEPISAGDDKRSEVKEADLQVSRGPWRTIKKNTFDCAPSLITSGNATSRKERICQICQRRPDYRFLGIMDDLERVVAAATVNHQDYKPFLKGSRW